MTSQARPSDQAQMLRHLMQQPAVASGPSGACVRSIFVTSGKGGVGKTQIALNLAVALAQSGQRVALFDGQAGLGHLDLLCGLSGYWNITHVVSGARTLAEVCLSGPAGLHVFLGAAAFWEQQRGTEILSPELRLQWQQDIEQQHDWLIWDVPGNLPRSGRNWLRLADRIFLLTTPELTAIADAYAWLKGHRELRPTQVELLVNRADSVDQAREITERIQRTTRQFLQQDLECAGWLPPDAAVNQAQVLRQPFVAGLPQAEISRVVQQLARQVRHSIAPSAHASFLDRLETQELERAA